MDVELLTVEDGGIYWMMVMQRKLEMVIVEKDGGGIGCSARGRR